MNVSVQTGERMLSKGGSNDEVGKLKTELASVSAQRDLLRQALHHLEVRLVAERKFHQSLEGERENYESHITELHYVIAELKREINILKQRNVLAEDEEEESGREEEENLQTSPSSVTSGGDNSENLGEETRKADFVESAGKGRNEDLGGKETTPTCFAKDLVDEKSPDLMSNLEENQESCTNFPERGVTIRQASFLELTSIRNEVKKIRKEHSVIRMSLEKRDAELECTKRQLWKIGGERDELREKVAQLEMLMTSQKLNRVEVRFPNVSPEQDLNIVAKVAEKAKLNRNEWKRNNKKRNEEDLSPSTTNNILNNNYIPLEEKGTKERQVSKSIFDLIPTSSSVSSPLVEHLAEPMQNESIIKAGSWNEKEGESVIRELVVGKDRLTAQIAHMMAENEVLRLNLETSKDTSDSLYEKLGKHESNDSALRLLLKYSDDAIETYDVLVALFESELGQLILSCRAAGIGNPMGQDSVDLEYLLGRAYENRLIAHTVAHTLLQKRQDEEVISNGPECYSEVSKEPSCSYSKFGSTVGETMLSSPASSSGCESGEGEMKRFEIPNPQDSLEGRVRDLIIDLKRKRENLRCTLVEVDWNQEPGERRVSPTNRLECSRMDLETALLMQELMHMREERAELKSQLFLLEKENGTLRTCAQVAATEKLILKSKLNDLGEGNLNSTSSTGDLTNGNPPPPMAAETTVYKERIGELLRVLDQVMESSAERGKEDAEMIRELKEAHRSLMATLEKTKVKYHSRIQKLEEYVLSVVEKKSKRELSKNCI